ncbi:MAG: DUF885 domain-containing protein [Bacteroidota bacterium]
MKESPMWATSLGINQYNDQLPSASPEDANRRAEFWRNILVDLTQVDRSKLSEQDQVNYDLFKFILDDDIEQVAYESYLIPIASDGGFHTSLIYSIKDSPFNTTEDYQHFIKRLEGVKKYMEQHINLMRMGLEKGWSVPQVVLKDYELALVPYINKDPQKSDFYQPFREMPEQIAPSEREEIQQKAQAAITESVIPGFQSFHDFLVKEYRPKARTTLGASHFPNGKAYYAQRTRYFTTLDIEPEEIFQIGEKEVARIRRDMEAIIEELNFEGSFSDFLNFLRTDPQFYAKTPRELLREAAYFSKKIDAALPRFFGKLPRLPYGVAPVPDAIAPKYTTGRYVPGSLANHQSGTYWVNTYKLESRPLYVLPSLTLHEAVPGHHLQIALAEEIEGVPEFRKHTYLSSYGEGWALYCEWLGLEPGIYETPYSRFGRLTYEMWRACRLVVDVGIHQKDWTRERAVEFMASNTALSFHEVNTEIDRYIAWPGQALSYKMGELKIRELRKKAEAALKEKFNLRDFHDLVLSKGAVPMYVLEKMVNQYIKQNL